jgi:hypothetical protein
VRDECDREREVEVDVRVDAGQVSGLAHVRVAVQQHDGHTSQEPVVDVRLEQGRVGADERLVGVAEAGVDLERHGVPGRLESVGE